jgi:hypothetical protein
VPRMPLFGTTTVTVCTRHTAGNNQVVAHAMVCPRVAWFNQV